jgi:hypothetical protein
MFIDFRLVQAVSSEKVYAGLHEHHKEDYKKKLSAIDEYSEKVNKKDE